MAAVGAGLAVAIAALLAIASVTALVRAYVAGTACAPAKAVRVSAGTAARVRVICQSYLG